MHSIHNIECMCKILYKRSKQCQRCQGYTIQISMHLMLCNGMYVEDVEDGVEQKCVCMFFFHLRRLQHT